MLILKNPLLTSFESICRLGTIHAAAKELCVTQTAITQRIKALESGLGVTLFIRSRSGMRLTTEGHALLLYQKNISMEEGEFVSKIAGQNHQEINLTLVGPTSAISTRFAESCKALYKTFPFLRLHLRCEDHLDLIAMLKRGEADLAIVPPTEVPNEMRSKILKPERYLLVASSKWKNRSLSDILKSERIIDFYDSDSTTLNYLKKFAMERTVNKSRLFVNENSALIKYFIEGIGFGTLTESLAKPHIDEGSLLPLNRGQALEIPIALVWYERSKQLNYFQEIIRAIK